MTNDFAWGKRFPDSPIGKMSSEKTVGIPLKIEADDVLFSSRSGSGMGNALHRKKKRISYNNLILVFF
jgi:hypothetical protein